MYKLEDKMDRVGKKIKKKRVKTSKYKLTN